MEGLLNILSRFGGITRSNKQRPLEVTVAESRQRDLTAKPQ